MPAVTGTAYNDATAFGGKDVLGSIDGSMSGDAMPLSLMSGPPPSVQSIETLTNNTPSFTPVLASTTSSPPPPPPPPKASKQSKKRSLPSESSSVSPECEGGRVVKRQRNTEAARRYRQRKVDKLTEVEEALAAMTKERDEYKLKLAKAETEVEILRGMVGRK